MTLDTITKTLNFGRIASVNTRRCSSIACALVLLALNPAAAQNKTADTPTSAAAKASAGALDKLPDFISRSLPSDTPLIVGSRFMNEPPPALSIMRFFKHNKISASEINREVPPNTLFKIPMSLIEGKSVFIQVISLTGTAEMRMAEGAAPSKLTKGSRIPELATLSTGDKSNLRLALPDGSVMSVLNNSRLTISKLQQLSGTDIFQIEISQVTGRLETKVSPLKSAASSFNIRSERTVTGVRGTEFNVSDRNGENAVVEVPEGAVALNDKVGKTVALPVGFGSYVVDSQASDKIPLLTQPRLINSDRKQKDAAAELQFTQQAGAAATRIDITNNANPGESLISSVLDKAVWPAQSLSAGDYTAQVRAIDPNGLQGYPLTLKVSARGGDDPRIEPVLKWVSDTQSLFIQETRPGVSTLTADKKAPQRYALELKAGGNTASAVERRYIESSNRHIPLETLTTGHHQVRVAKVIAAGATQAEVLGSFSDWLAVFKP